MLGITLCIKWIFCTSDGKSIIMVTSLAVCGEICYNINEYTLIVNGNGVIGNEQSNRYD